MGVERRAGVTSVGRTIDLGARAAATVTVVPPEPNAAEACVSQSAAARRSCRGKEQPRCAGARAAAAERRLRQVYYSLGLVRGGVRAGG